MFLTRSYFFIIIKKTATKSPTLIMFRVAVAAEKVINRVSNFWPKMGKSWWKWSGYHGYSVPHFASDLKCHLWFNKETD